VGVLEQGTFWYWILHTEEAKTIYNEVWTSGWVFMPSLYEGKVL
jgi:hypothetical protein